MVVRRTKLAFSCSPTAQALPADRALTSWNMLILLPPPTLGVATLCHPEPVLRTLRVCRAAEPPCVPTAHWAVADGVETPSRLSPCPVPGTVSRAQLVPLKRSTRGLLLPITPT